MIEIKNYIVLLSFYCFFSPCVLSQDLNIESYSHAFKDTFIEKIIRDSFVYRINYDFEFKVQSAIEGDSSFVTIEITNNYPIDLWLGISAWQEFTDSIRWGESVLPSFNLNYILLSSILPNETAIFHLKQKGHFRHFDFATYMMTDYQLFVTPIVNEEYKPDFFNCGESICLRVPPSEYPKEGITYFSLEGFPMNEKSNLVQFKIISY